MISKHIKIKAKESCSETLSHAMGAIISWVCTEFPRREQKQFLREIWVFTVKMFQLTTQRTYFKPPWTTDCMKDQNGNQYCHYYPLSFKLSLLSTSRYEVEFEFFRRRRRARFRAFLSTQYFISCYALHLFSLLNKFPIGKWFRWNAILLIAVWWWNRWKFTRLAVRKWKGGQKHNKNTILLRW